MSNPRHNHPWHHAGSCSDSRQQLEATADWAAKRCTAPERKYVCSLGAAHSSVQGFDWQGFDWQGQGPTSEARVHCHMACRRCTRATSGAVCMSQLLLASLGALPPPMGGPGAEGRGVGSASALVTSWLKLASLQGKAHMSNTQGMPQVVPTPLVLHVTVLFPG